MTRTGKKTAAGHRAPGPDDILLYHKTAGTENGADRPGLPAHELVVMDMDNVIVHGQSQLRLLRFLLANRYVGLGPPLKIFGWYSLYKAGLLKNPADIGNYAFAFLRDWPVDEVRAIFENFFARTLRESIFPECRRLIASHRAAGREICIVSSACDLIVARVAAELDIDRFICTTLETRDGRYTGRTRGPLIYGREKETRAAPLLARYRKTWACADHISDLPLLLAVSRPTAVNPCRRLAREARRRQWPILRFHARRPTA